MSVADVVEHVTHAITQSAISAKVTAHPARIVVEVADLVRRYALTGMVCTGPITRAVYEEPDGTHTEELSGQSRLDNRFTVFLTGPLPPLTCESPANTTKRDGAPTHHRRKCPMPNPEIPMVLMGRHAADTTLDVLASEAVAKQLEDDIARNVYTTIPPLVGRRHKPHASALTVRLMRLAHRRSIGSAPMPHTQMRNAA